MSFRLEGISSLENLTYDEAPADEGQAGLEKTRAMEGPGVFDARGFGVLDDLEDFLVQLIDGTEGEASGTSPMLAPGPFIDTEEGQHRGSAGQYRYNHGGLHSIASEVNARRLWHQKFDTNVTAAKLVFDFNPVSNPGNKNPDWFSGLEIRVWGSVGTGASRKNFTNLTQLATVAVSTTSDATYTKYIAFDGSVYDNLVWGWWITSLSLPGHTETDINITQLRDTEVATEDNPTVMFADGD